MKLNAMLSILFLGVSTLHADEVMVDINGVSQKLIFDATNLSISPEGVEGSVEGKLEVPVKVKCGRGEYRPLPGERSPLLRSFEYKGTLCNIFRKYIKPQD